MTRRPRRRLARRLLVGQALVITAGGVTLAGVAVLVGPALYRTHVRRAVGPVSDGVARHLDQAFSSALLISLAIAVAAAILTALAISSMLASRLARPVEDLSATATRIARGDLAARAPRPLTDDELTDLALTFNDMAEALERTEQTRRRLLADVAHELRTPLATIEGYVEALADGVVDPEPRTWEALRSATTRLRRLVDDVGIASRAEEGQLDLDPAPVDVGDLVDAAVAATTTMFDDAEVQLEQASEPDIPPVRVDPDRMAQVLENLLRNACRHTPPDGAVRVTSHAREGTVTIQVRDTGEGIPADQLPHVFERFYRGDAARRSGDGSGSGIGLTIARAITRMHGGDVTAHSPGPGRGATFTVTLPTDA